MNKTAVIEGRIDLRDLASCADYFIKQGMGAENKSDLLYKIVTTFARASQAQGSQVFTSTEEALGYMHDIGLGPVNRIKYKERRANAFTLSKVINAERAMEEAPSKEEIEIDIEELERIMRTNPTFGGEKNG